MEHKTTPEVAQRFGIDPNSLLSYLSRHPNLRPALKVGTAFLWKESEIDAVARHRMRPISRGRRKAKTK